MARLVWIGGRKRQFDQDAIADVAGADADGTYGAEEAALINEIKGQTNEILAALRAAGIVKSS
jgi:hypothetical protein